MRRKSAIISALLVVTSGALVLGQSSPALAAMWNLYQQRTQGGTYYYKLSYPGDINGQRRCITDGEAYKAITRLGYSCRLQ